MPDTTGLPVAEGGASTGGKTNWPMLIGIGGVGVVVLVMLMKKQGASGTTAAGTSINAALGSIQEENLNLMGQVGAAQSSLASEIGGATGLLSNQMAANQSAVTNQITGLSGQLTDVGTNLSNQQLQSLQMLQALGVNVGDLTNLTQQQIASIAQIGGTLENYDQQLLMQLNAVNQGVVAGNQNVITDLQQAVNNINGTTQAGTGAGWAQFNTIMHELGVPGY